MRSFEHERRAVLRAAALGAVALVAGGGPSNAQAAIRNISVERLTVVSAKPFTAVVSAFESSIGRPDMNEFMKALGAAQTYADMEKVVQGVVGPFGLMQFARYDLGFVIGKEAGRQANSSRFLVGNPLIMKDMAKHVPDAGSYAPVTVLIDERAGGVHLSYDKMASFLAPYGNEDALKVARDLDVKIETILKTAAA